MAEQKDRATIKREQAIGRLKTLHGVDDKLAGALYDAGFTTPGQVRVTPALELETVPGVEPALVKEWHTPITGTEERKVGRRTIKWNKRIGGPVLPYKGEGGDATGEGAATGKGAATADVEKLENGESTLAPAKTTATEPVPVSGEIPAAKPDGATHGVTHGVTHGATQKKVR